MRGFNVGSRSVLKAAEMGPGLRTAQKLALIGAAVLWFLLFWWSGWDWWPGVVYAGVPLLIVILPGIRRLVDESWGLVVGLALFALQLMPDVDGALVAIAWGAAIAAVSAATIRRRRHGWRQWAPWIGVAVGGLLAGVAFLVWLSYEADRDAAAAARAAEDRRYQLSKLYPPTPRSAIFQLIDGVVTPPKREGICFMFSPTAEQQFAQTHGAADCEGALANLQRQITDFGGYVNYMYIPRTAEVDLSPGVVQLDACRLEFSSWLTGGPDNPGPQLGRFEFEQQYGNGWMVTTYQGCPK
ncbi:hypothetical protein [Amycolatopsis thermoflava]|uniref:hypothetical protein n=1 Tax=Amycolatopsis thermoflava TaxID=84480 RepID=UPI003EBB8139